MELVWLIEENTYGYVIQRHAFASLVAYDKDGTIVEEMFENEDLLDWKGHAIDYWSE